MYQHGAITLLEKWYSNKAYIICFWWANYYLYLVPRQPQLKRTSHLLWLMRLSWVCINMLQVNVDILFIKSINHINLSYISIICIYHSRWYTIHHIYQPIISIHRIHLSYVSIICIIHMYQFIKSINHHIHPLISIISI